MRVVFHLNNLAIVAAAVAAVGAGDIELAVERAVAAVVLYTWLVQGTRATEKAVRSSYAVPPALSVDLVARFPGHDGYDICLRKLGLAKAGRLKSRRD
jgi:hypothetical protein